MKSLKQDLVGFRWSAFFEPRLPFTRVPVKLPLPHLSNLSRYLCSFSRSSLLLSFLFSLALSLILACSLSAPPASNLPYPSFSVHIVNLQW